MGVDSIRDAVFLTSLVFGLVRECMRRVLRILTAFEPTRLSDGQLQLAYERLVETLRRTASRDSDDASASADSQSTSWDRLEVEARDDHGRRG